MKRAFVLFRWGPALLAPRKTSTSDQVEKLAKGVDIVVHSAIHPVLAPEKGAQERGFTGNIVVGTDLATIRLPAK